MMFMGRVGPLTVAVALAGRHGARRACATPREECSSAKQ